MGLRHRLVLFYFNIFSANSPPTIDAPTEFHVKDGDNYTTYITITDDRDSARNIIVERNVSSIFNLNKISE